MSDGLHLLDIIFFAAVAAFLIMRLRSVLGRRTGNERPPPAWPDGKAESKAGDVKPSKDNVIDLAALRKPVSESGPQPIFTGPAAEGLAAIHAADPRFTVETFLPGARAAFQLIVAAYADGDNRVLRPLLSDDVYRNFSAAIDARAKAGEQLETKLARIRSAEVVSARLEGSEAQITVRFDSDQVNVVRDAHDAIVDGDPDRATEIIDEWTFRRTIPSANPNWELVATRSPEV
jgi:predicted lipid-binding transport protein (Tim44 family)